MELGGASRNSTGFGAMEEGLMQTRSDFFQQRVTLKLSSLDALALKAALAEVFLCKVEAVQTHGTHGIHVCSILALGSPAEPSSAEEWWEAL